jgi:potassium efflux system protein
VQCDAINRLVQDPRRAMQVARGVERAAWRRHLGRWLVLSVWLSCFIAGQVAASETLVARAESLRGAIDASANLTDEQKTQANKRLDEVLSFATEVAEAGQAREAIEERLATAPKRIEELAAQETLVAEAAVPPPDQLSLAQLENALSDQRTQTATLQLAREDRARRLNDLLNQNRSDAKALSELERQLSDLGAAAPATAADESLLNVEKLWREARAAGLDARIDLLRLRQGNIDLLTELARRESDVASARLEEAQRRQAELTDILQSRRQQEAAALVSATEGAGSQAPSGLRAIQAEIAALAREQTNLLNKETEFQRRLDRVKQTNERLKRDYERIQQIVELGGSSAQVSGLLQKRREIAPSPERLGIEAFELQQEFSDAGLRQIELDETLQQLIDTSTTIDYLRSRHALDAGTFAQGAKDSRVADLASLFRQSVLDLWQSYTRYLTVLSQLEANTRTLATEAERYQGFINDRLLWVPSTELLPLSDPKALIEGVQWFIEPDTLQSLLDDMVRLPQSMAAVLLLWILGAVILLVMRRPAHKTLRSCATAIQKIRTDSIFASLKALVATLVLVVWLPWLLIGAGLLLGYLPNASDATLTYGAGLQAVGQVFVFLNLTRQLCRTGGLARAHLNWHPALCDALVRQARWLLPIVAPLGFFVAAGSASVPSDFVRLTVTPQLDNAGLVSLGRLAFAAQMIMLLIAVHRVWRRQGPVMTAFGQSDDHHKWTSYHILWFGPALMAPLLLAVWALLGYFYSAVFILSVAGETLWFILAAIIGKDLLFRSLYVVQRRLRFQDALRRRDELIAQRAADIEGAAPAEEKAVEAIEQEKVDYRRLGDQARSLVQFGYTLSILVGLWWIWRDIFPAFSFLDSIELPITTSKLIDGVTQDVPLTLGDMVTGLLLGGLALFAAMKVPAILELTLLQRLPLSRASRYAVTTLLQYIVAMVGLVITFNALGLQWSSVQWLVAALSVGLGFGLQEIVANFVSGVILLFEQPIRVGDVVTVDGTTGTVSKIRIRATTIINYDRQELVIPNKTFITGQLINWTLSDTVNRVLITVGVSYGSDTRQAMELIRQAAQEHPNVLDDPAPMITFEAFGDNSLTLNLRAYLGDLERRLATITELHQAILDKFREADIEISFPQRDVHLTTIEPLELKLRR